MAQRAVVVPESIGRGRAMGPGLQRALVLTLVARGRPEAKRPAAGAEAEEQAAGLEAAVGLNVTAAEAVAALRVTLEHPDLVVPDAVTSDALRDAQDAVLSFAAGVEEAAAAFRAADFEATASSVWPIAPAVANRLRTGARRWDETRRALTAELDSTLEAFDDLIDLHAAREALIEGGEPILHEDVRRRLGLGR